MATRIKLRDGTEALVQATLDELKKAVVIAMRSSQLIEIEQPDGSVAVINPHEIQYFVEDPGAAPSRQFETTG